MPIKAEAFVAIDGMLTERLASSLRLATAKVYAAIEKALDAFEWETAIKLVDSISLSSVFENSQDLMTAAPTAAMTS